MPGASEAGTLKVPVRLLAMSSSDAQWPGLLPLIWPCSSILDHSRDVLSTVVQSPLQSAR